jgi:amidohydrolase
MEHLNTRIKEVASKIAVELQSVRHHIHANPELSFQEFETALFVEYKLNSWGIATQRMATTGVIGWIEGGKPGKTMALRADLDALPILEKNNTTYRSKVDGVMHACGHDVHTTCLLGAAYILQQIKDEIHGNIKLVFQPGEEKLPGGASLLIKEGVLTNPPVDFIVGQHVMPLIEVGNVGFREGLYMASTDEIYLTIKGKGGHGAMPHLCLDPVVIAASIVVELQQLVSRFCPPHIPCVLSFGKFIANGVTNVIPDEVVLEGTFRTLDENWRSKAHGIITDFVQNAVKARGATCELNIEKGYPFLKNDVQLTKQCRQSAQQFLGNKQVEELDIWMAAEDFSWYSQEVPACFYRLGIRNEEKGIVHSVHNPRFDIDERALELGAGLMAFIAVDALQKAL